MGKGEIFNRDTPEDKKERGQGVIADTEKEFLPSVVREQPNENLARVDRQELNNAQENDVTLEWVRQRAAEKQSHFEMKDWLFIRKIKDHRRLDREQMIVPSEFRKVICPSCHDNVGGT